MDKNFVNIDNLVRQRLGGGEEQERSGSWAKMNALLDKEMPQERPLGGFGWRGLFGTVAVLLFVGTVGVGGYKIIMSGKDAGTQGVTTAVTEVPGLSSGSPEGQHRIATPGMEHAMDNNARNTTAGVNEGPAAMPGSSNAANDNSHTAADAAPEAGRTAGVPAATATGDKNRTTVNDAANDNAATAALNTRNATGNTTTAKKHNNNNNGKPDATGAMANNNKPAGSNAAAHRGTEVNTRKMAVSSSTPAGKHIAPVVNVGAVNNATTANITTDANNTSGGRDADESNRPVFVTKSGKRISGDKLQKINFDKAKQHEHKQNVAVAEAPKNKRVIQKMAIVQRFVKTDQGDGFYKLDTVSVTTLTEELGIITETKVLPPASKKVQGEADADSKNKGMMTTRGKKSSRVLHSSSMGNYNADKAEAINNKAKKTGAITLEHINAAFNDVKYRMSCARFGGGITGGVNSTFFGSSALRGFQFGVFGEVTVSERVSVVGELKYFNRISGSNAVNDNYYNYTPNATGGYTKELQVNSYTFSSVHSFEMPVAVRFTQGRLNLFAGGNLAYSMGVSTGSQTSADPNSRTVVSVVGNDNTPGISYKDFGSRVGVGYLFGASYQVSPRINLDLRNVQTVWDNSKGAGAKAVSSQVYRNPSIQFSIGYRFSAKKKD